MGRNNRWDDLAARLRALGDPSRLTLVSSLEKPRPLDEIDLSPSNPRPGSNPDRTLTQEGIRHHLRTLREHGFVRVDQHEARNGRTHHLFQRDPSYLLELSLDLQDLLLPAESDPSEEEEETGKPTRSQGSDEGPRYGSRPSEPHVMIVHGANRGRTVSLTGSSRPTPRGWLLGASSKTQIHLEHDRMIDGEHAEILPEEGGHELVDLRSSPETRLNDHALPVGGKASLVDGDVIGVGRTLLVFGSG